MRKLLVNRKKLIRKINTATAEEYLDNQLEENQVMRAYSAGIIDGYGMVIRMLSNDPVSEAPSFPLSISFYEEDTYDSRVRQAQRKLEHTFERQDARELALFGQEAD